MDGGNPMPAGCTCTCVSCSGESHDCMACMHDNGEVCSCEGCMCPARTGGSEPMPSADPAPVQPM